MVLEVVPVLFFDAPDDFAVELFAVFAAPVDFDDFDLPDALSAAAFAFAAFARAALLSSLSIKSPTASATTFNALSAAPVAAPVRISPAASLTASKTGDFSFLVDFFAPVEVFFVSLDFAVVADFDFAPVELFAEVVSLAVDFDFAAVAALVVDFDFAGAAGFVVVFWFSFFAAIFLLPLLEFINYFVNSI